MIALYNLKLKNMKLLKLTPILLAVVFLQSCSTTTSTSKKETASGNWLLATMNDSPINRMVILPTLTIDAASMTISGNGGCNTYNGPIETLNNAAFTVSDKMISTLMACDKENIESQYLLTLSKANKYDVKNDMLNIYDKGGKKILSFVKNQNVAANQRLHDIWMATSINGRPINKMVTVPRMEINLTEMKIFGTDGCNDYNGMIEKSSDKELKFGRIASTRKMCPEMQVADNFNKALTTVASYKLDGLKLHLMDSKGKEVLSFLKVD